MLEPDSIFVDALPDLHAIFRTQDFEISQIFGTRPPTSLGRNLRSKYADLQKRGWRDHSAARLVHECPRPPFHSSSTPIQTLNCPL